MSASEIITLVIALYSAVLATYLGWREWKKERRKIVVYLQRIMFYEKMKLVISNSGYRPVTITSISMEMNKKVGNKIKPTEGIPARVMFASEDEYKKIPFTLNDGEQMDFNISDQLVAEVDSREEEKARVRVEDSEGRIYNSDEVRLYNPKFEAGKIE